MPIAAQAKPVALANTVTGLNQNAVLWNTDGSMRYPGQTTNLPKLLNKSASKTILVNGVSTSVKVITTNFDPNPTQNSIPSGTNSTPFANGTYGTYSYQINYDAILNWLKNTGPTEFPAQMRAGGILYYSSIPTTVGRLAATCR